MAVNRLKSELKKLGASDLVKSVTGQLVGYERTLATFVRDIESRSRSVRTKGWKSVQSLASQLKERRADIEATVEKLLNSEALRLNRRVTSVLNYLKTLAKSEKLASKANAFRKKIPRARPRVSATTTRKRHSARKNTRSSPIP